jgi:hypothetical protein
MPIPIISPLLRRLRGRGRARPVAGHHHAGAAPARRPGLFGRVKRRFGLGRRRCGSHSSAMHVLPSVTSCTVAEEVPCPQKPVASRLLPLAVVRFMAGVASTVQHASVAPFKHILAAVKHGVTLLRSLAAVVPQPGLPCELRPHGCHVTDTAALCHCAGYRLHHMWRPYTNRGIPVRHSFANGIILGHHRAGCNTNGTQPFTGAPRACVGIGT